jgi:hypothetical protein
LQKLQMQEGRSYGSFCHVQSPRERILRKAGRPVL